MDIPIRHGLLRSGQGLEQRSSEDTIDTDLSDQDLAPLVPTEAIMCRHPQSAEDASLLKSMADARARATFVRKPIAILVWKGCRCMPRHT